MACARVAASRAWRRLKSVSGYTPSSEDDDEPDGLRSRDDMATRTGHRRACEHRTCGRVLSHREMPGEQLPRVAMRENLVTPAAALAASPAKAHMCASGSPAGPRRTSRSQPRQRRASSADGKRGSMARKEAAEGQRRRAGPRGPRAEATPEANAPAAVAPQPLAAGARTAPTHWRGRQPATPRPPCKHPEPPHNDVSTSSRSGGRARLPLPAPLRAGRDRGPAGCLPRRSRCVGSGRCLVPASGATWAPVAPIGPQAHANGP